MELLPPASFFWLAIAIAGGGALCLILFKLQLMSSRQCKPPGPRPWPIVGNLNLIGSLPHQSLHRLSQKYGPLIQLKFGSFPVVVASSAEMAKQFLKTHDHVFASRPPTAAGKYTTYNYCNMTWAPYGSYWRQARKLYLSELFSSKRLESYEYIRVEERQAFLSRLQGMSGKPVVLREHLSLFTLTVMSRIVLGKKYFRIGSSNSNVDCNNNDNNNQESENDMFTLEEFQEMLDELFLLNGVFNIGDWIPWIDWLDLQGYVKRMKDLNKKFDRFHNQVMEEHRARRRAEKQHLDDKDMMDLLLQLADDDDLEVKLNNDCVKGLIQDLIAGGTDTSATSVEWAMSEVLKHPHIIDKATQELDRVIGRERWVEEKDMARLPYIDSIMKETMRLHPVAVLLAPHLSLKDCTVSGFHIQKGTRVFINTWSIGRDSAIWEEPHVFNPERMMLENGTVIDVKGQNFELLPFGSGRRMCPGYPLGLKMIGSSLANLLQGFNWKLPENMKPGDISMEEDYGLTTVPKIPLVAVMEPRLPAYLYCR